MSSALQRESSSTVSSRNSEQSSSDHSHHPRLDGAIAEETGADQSTLVNSTTETQIAPMFPGTVTMLPPDTGRVPSSTESYHVLDPDVDPDVVLPPGTGGAPSFTESFHIPNQSATDHGNHRVEGASHRTKTCNTSLVEETGAGKISPQWYFRTQMAAALHIVGALRRTSNDVIVGETGAGKSSPTANTQTAPISPGTMMSSFPDGRALSTSKIPDQSPSDHRVGDVSCCTDTSEAGQPASIGETGAGKSRWPNWFVRKQNSPTSLDTILYPGRTSPTVRTAGQHAVYLNYHQIQEASYCADTCNVVIFGETGSGKSSLVNLITGKEKAPTSADALGCTPEPTVYEHDVMTQNKSIKVQLFDTAGLDEGTHGKIPATQGQKALKVLLKTLKKNRGIHLLIYCVHGTKDVKTLQRNYKLVQSKVKGKVPIVLVVTGLEDREPDMEDWWRNNEASISALGMNFAGHACITAVTIDQADTDELRGRREQSYDAVYKLFEHCRPQNRTRVQWMTPIPPARKTKNIVLFGEAGAGKSSIVNLMAGKDVAFTSPGMQRCTLQWQDYTINFDEESYKVFDTIGIEESGLEMEEYLVAVANAYKFIKALDAEGGVDLLLFCIRAGRFTAALQSNYRFFYEFLCEKKVPIVLAITNLEREQKMEDWWDREHSIFPRYDIHVAGHACITAANGLDGRHQQLYEESRIAIRELVKENITGDHNKGWTGGNNVLVSLVRALRKLLVTNTHIRKMNLIGQLTKRCGMPRETAGQLADMIEQGEARVDAA